MNNKSYFWGLLKLSFPIILGQMGQMLIVAGDVYIATMYSTRSVASIGIASGFINPVFLFGIGLMMGISPILAQRRGQGHDDQRDLFSIIAYALGIGIFISLVMILLVNFTDLFGIEPELLPTMNEYITVVCWSFPFAIIFQGVKEFLQSFEKVFVANMISIIAVVLNLIINYLLVFGFGSFGGFGEVGLAYASIAVRVFLCIAVLLYAKKYIHFSHLSFSFIKRIFKFGFPVAFMFFLEVLAFCTVSVLSGRLGITAAAANNIIMTMASIAFMVPLSISSAVGVKIGHAFGQKDRKLVLEYIKAALITIGLYVGFSSSIFYFAPNLLMGFMTTDPVVLELGVKLLLIVAFFQLADGFQVILSGILRGMDDTRTSFILVLIGYWIIGIPTGYYLTFSKGWGTQGLWIGLAISLFLVAGALCVFTLRRYKKIL